MTTNIWDKLNKQGGIYQAGIYIVQDGKQRHLLEYLNDKFSPIGVDYFKNNPTMLDRSGWYYITENGTTKIMDAQHSQARKAYEQLFYEVMTPFASHLPNVANSDYGNAQHWGAAMNQLVKLGKQQTQKSKQQTQNPNSAVNKAGETLGVKPDPVDIGSNMQVPQDEKPLAKDLRDKVESSALANVQDFLSQIDPYLAGTINRQDFHQLTKNDLNLFSQASKWALAMKKHGWSAEQQDIVDKLDNFLNTRAEAQILSTLDVPVEERREYLNNYFRQLPDLKKGTIPKASQFGFMPPNEKNGLSYLVNQNLSLDSMNQLIATGYKVVFNPNLLSPEGAERYAKQIKGSVAPIYDYDGDGLKDVYIYDKTGKIAVINGHRLKRDDKAVLKRLFYQQYPAKERKKMGGFKGWLNTVLFQVGPYNWKGERTVRVTKENWEMLQFLHDKGYLKKKPEAFLPKTNKSFSSTVKTHILDSIKSALKRIFPSQAKSTWYLPINQVRDVLYKIIAGSYMHNIAQQRGILSSLESTMTNYNSSKQKQNSKNQLFKLLSQWCSKDENAKAELAACLEEIVNKYIPQIHIIGVGLLLQNTSYLGFIDQTHINDTALNKEEPGGTLRTYLMQEKVNWAGQIKPALQKFFEDFFPGMNEQAFKQLVQYYSSFIVGLGKDIAPNFNVNQTIYKEFALPASKNDFTGKYEKYNVDDADDVLGLEDIRTTEFKRWDGARPYNAEVIAGNKYANDLRNWRSLRN